MPIYGVPDAPSKWCDVASSVRGQPFLSTPLRKRNKELQEGFGDWNFFHNATQMLGSSRHVFVSSGLINKTSCRSIRSVWQERHFCSSGRDVVKPTEWRQKQLQDLERKWDENPLDVQSEEDLQPMWKDMEKRLRNRRPRSTNESRGLSGRQNVKRTDEEFWLDEGLYNVGEKKL